MIFKHSVRFPLNIKKVESVKLFKEILFCTSSEEFLPPFDDLFGSCFHFIFTLLFALLLFKIFILLQMKQTLNFADSKISTDVCFVIYSYNKYFK